MSTAYPNNCIQQSILPELNKLVANQEKSRTIRAASERSFAQLKSKPLSQFHDTYREAFKARLFNPEQQYSSVGSINASGTRDLIGDRSKRTRHGHVDRIIISRIGFICNSLKLIEDHLAETVRDPKVMAHIAELFKFMGLLTDDISRSFSDMQHKVRTEQSNTASLNQKIAELQQDNAQLFDYNQTLIKYEKGVNQLKLSHENDKLRLEIEQLTRILTTKEKTIDELVDSLTLANEKNDEYDAYKAGIDVKLSKLKEELELSEHTRQLNLATKMKYLLGIE